MAENHHPARTITQLRNRLKRIHQRARKQLQTKHPHTHQLFKKAGFQPHQLRKHATRLLAGATMATALLAQPSSLSALPKDIVPNHLGQYAQEHKLSVIEAFSSQLKSLLPQDRGQLNPWEIGQINQLLTPTFNLTATADLEGHRLLHQ